MESSPPWGKPSVARGWFKLHIDHLDNPNGDIWAVDGPDRYRTARSKDVVISPGLKFKLIGPRKTQPRAYLRAYGTVKQSHGTIFLGP